MKLEIGNLGFWKTTLLDDSKSNERNCGKNDDEKKREREGEEEERVNEEGGEKC